MKSNQKGFIKLLMIVLAVVITGIFLIMVSYFNDTPQYVRGHIMVGFNGDVTEAEVHAFLKSYNLTLERPLISSDTYKIMTDYKPEILGEQGSQLRNQMVNEIVGKIIALPKSNIYDGVLSADVRNDKILLLVGKIMTEDRAREIINNFDGLKFISLKRDASYGLVKVPAWQEKKWVEIFQKSPIVSYAVLDRVVSIR